MPNKIAGKNIVWLTVAFVFLLVAINFHFIVNYSSGLIKADHWRHFEEILIPLEQGTTSFRLWWENHHPNPILHLYEVLVSGPVFQFDLKYDALFSLALHVLIFLLLWRAVYKVTEGPDIYKLALGIIFSGFYWFSIITPHTFLWTLISLQSLGFVFGILAAVSLLNFSGSEAPAVKDTVKIFIWCTLGILLNFDYGVLFFGSILAALFLHILWNRDWELVKQAFLLTCLLGLSTYVISKVFIPDSVGVKMDILATVKNFVQYLWGVSTSIASGIVGENIYRPNFLAVKEQYGIANIVFTCALTVVYLIAVFAALKMKRRALILLSLLAYPGLFSLAVFMGRETQDFHVYLSAPRYATNFKIGWLAAILVFFMYWRFFDLTRFMRWTSIVLASASIIFWSYGTLATFKVAHYWEASSDRSEVLLYMVGTEDVATVKLDRSITGANINYEPVVEFLLKKEYNVFSKGYDAGELLKKYQENQKSFELHSEPAYRFKMEASKSVDRFSDKCLSIPSIAEKSFQLELDYVDTGRLFVTIPVGDSVERYQALSGTNIFYGASSRNDAKICVAGSIRFKNAQD